MISYLQAARELDARWTGSLQFLPPTPCLRSADDCMVARQIATTEIDLFNRYAREIAAENGLKFSLLIDLHNMLLITGRMEVSNETKAGSDGVSHPQIVRFRRPHQNPAERSQACTVCVSIVDRANLNECPGIQGFRGGTTSRTHDG